MKIKDMVPEIRYVVTKGGSTLSKKDNVWLDYDGSLMCLQGGGWLMPQEWKQFRNEVEIDKAYYEEQIKKMKAKIEMFEKIIKEHGK